MDDTRISPFMCCCFTEEQISLLFKDSATMQKKKNELLYKFGDIVKNYYYLQTGKLKLYVLQTNGAIRTESYYQKGAILGCVNSFSEMPSYVYCEAIMDSVLLACPKEIFWDRIVKYNLVEKYTTLEAQKINFGWKIKSVLEDTLQFIEQMLEYGLTQQEIADFLGYSRVQVSRLCSQLKRNSKVS